MGDSKLSFRTAINGFHRGDVVAYIGKLSADYQSELAQKEQELRQAKKEIVTLKQMLLLCKNEPKAEVQPSNPEPAAEDSLKTQELEAYRRAERFEREAQSKVQKRYNDACEAVAQAQSALLQQESKFDSLDQMFTETAVTVRTTMDEIRAALNETHERIQKLRQDE